MNSSLYDGVLLFVIFVAVDSDFSCFGLPWILIVAMVIAFSLL